MRFNLLQLHFMAWCRMINGGKVLPNALTPIVITAMNNYQICAIIVLVRKFIGACTAEWFLPSDHWSQSVSNLGSVGRTGVMPAVVASSVFVDGEVVAATGRAGKLSFFFARF